MLKGHEIRKRVQKLSNKRGVRSTGYFLKRKGHVYNFGDLILTTFCTVRFLVVFHEQWLQLSSVSYREVWGLAAGLNTGSFSLVVYTVLVFYPSLEILLQIWDSHIIALQNLQRFWQSNVSGSGGVRQPSQCWHCPHRWGILHLLRYKCNGFRWRGGKNVRKEGQQKTQ